MVGMPCHWCMNTVCSCDSTSTDTDHGTHMQTFSLHFGMESLYEIPDRLPWKHNYLEVVEGSSFIPGVLQERGMKLMRLKGRSRRQMQRR